MYNISLYGWIAAWRQLGLGGPYDAQRSEKIKLATDLRFLRIGIARPGLGATSWCPNFGLQLVCLKL